MELIAKFLKYLTVKNYSNNTLQAYNVILVNFFKYLVSINKNFLEVKMDDIIDYIATMKSDNYAPATINLRLIAMKSFYKYLWKTGIHDGRIDIPMPKVEKKTIKILSVEEIKRILNSIPLNSMRDYRDRAMIELLYVTGMRLGEFIQLTHEDFQFVELKKFSKKRHLIIHVKGKGQRERNIFVNEQTAEIVMLYLAKREDKCPFLFVGHWHSSKEQINGLRKSSIRSALRVRAKKGRIGKRIYPHILRHSIATHLLQAGVNIFAIQKFLGHSSLDTTRQYLELLDVEYRSVCEDIIPKILYTR